MNKDEIDDIIDYLDRAFPRGARPDMPAMEVWETQLAGLDHVDAMKAAEVLPRELDLFPTIAQLAGRTRDFARQRSMSNRALPAPGQSSEATRAAWLPEIRAQIAGLDLSADRENGEEAATEKHTGEHWDSCQPCIERNARVRRAIASV